MFFAVRLLLQKESSATLKLAVVVNAELPKVEKAGLENRDRLLTAIGHPNECSTVPVCP
jgi:hypothetical protein